MSFANELMCPWCSGKADVGTVFDPCSEQCERLLDKALDSVPQEIGDCRWCVFNYLVSCINDAQEA